MWIPLYEDRIGRWRDYLKKSPGTGEATKEVVEQLLRTQWEEQDNELLHEMKEAILTNPVLKRPVPNRRFHLKDRLERERPSRGASTSRMLG